MKNYYTNTNNREILGFYYLYFSLIIFAYILDQYAIVIFWSLFLFFLNSKKDYYWIALFFLLSESPGYLLSYFDRIHNLAYYGLIISETKQIFFQELVCIFFLIKALFLYKGKGYKTLFSSAINAIYIYSLILFFISFFYDFPINRIFKTIRVLIPLSLFFSIPVLMKSFENYMKLFNIVKYFIFFVVFVQVLDLFTGERLAYLLGGERRLETWSTNYNLEVREFLRPMYSYYYIFIISIFTLAILSSKSFVVRKKNLISIIAMSYFAIFISATRGYIIAITLLFALTGIYTSSFKAYKKKILSLGLIILVLIILVPNLQKQFIGVSERLSTVELLVQGDITAGGTLSRIDIRGANVWKAFIDSPMLIGYAFSENFWTNMDNHVGPLTNLLNGGVIGILILVYFWFFFILKTLRLSSTNKPMKNPMRILVFGMIIFISIHFTSNMVFGFGVFWPFHGLMFVIPFLLDFTSKYYQFHKNILQINPK